MYPKIAYEKDESCVEYSLLNEIVNGENRNNHRSTKITFAKREVEWLMKFRCHQNKCESLSIQNCSKMDGYQSRINEG